jgi:hypothetical protein
MTERNLDFCVVATTPAPNLGVTHIPKWAAITGETPLNNSVEKHPDSPNRLALHARRDS